MLRSATVVVFVLLLCIGCSEPQTSEPLLVLGQEGLDLGEQMPNRRQRIAVEMLNHGTGPLTIQELRSSCSCSDARVSKTTINPNEHGELWIDVVPKSLGPGQATVTVVSDSTLRPLQTFKVEWTGVDVLVLEPNSIDFGEVRPGETMNHDLSIRYRPELLPGGKTCRVVSIEGLLDTGREFKGSLPLELTSAGVTKLGTVALTAGLAPGNNAARLTVVIDGVRQEQLPVLFSWRVVNAVEVVPERLSLGEMRVGSTEERFGDILIRSNENLLTIGEITTSHEWVEADVEKMSDGVARCRVRRTKELPVGIHAAEVTIAVAEPERATLTVPVSLIVSEQ